MFALENHMKIAILIRRVEEKLLDLFSSGKLNGTIHTCVGQEFSAIAFSSQLNKDDFLFSNHRCHGHYLAFTGDYKGLIGEVMGKSTGVCGGIGGSQHLCNGNFFSNGIQGGMLPVASGLAMAMKLDNLGRIVLAYIGDGTLGEGVVYETLNIISKWEIPILIVCENNFYAQSTSIEKNLAGDIIKRAEAFGIKTFKSDIWHTEELMHEARCAIDYVRKSSKPAFHLVETYRLNSHSKGDDYRQKEQIEEFRKRDPINVFISENPTAYKETLDEVDRKIDEAVEECTANSVLELYDYYHFPDKEESYTWETVEPLNSKQSDLIYSFFDEEMNHNRSIIFMGEDVLHPYGGAFKIARDLSAKYTDRVFSTPISEAAITGIAIGLSLGGFRPFVEIMFGDFVTLCMDQIINNASKFYQMYNKKVKCPVVMRMPMGGRRGYGPTHSQTMDKLLTGIPNVKTIALNSLINPKDLYSSILENEEHFIIVIENKIDYGKKINKKHLKNYIFEKTKSAYPVIRIRPIMSTPTITIVTYGGMVNTVLETVEDLFYEYDIKPEIIVLTQIYPCDFDVVIESVNATRVLYTVEEGSKYFGIGSEIVASVAENIDGPVAIRRIAALPVPIPAEKNLEAKVLPDKDLIIDVIGKHFKMS